MKDSANSYIASPNVVFLVATVAAFISVAEGSGLFSLWNTMVGAILLSLLWVAWPSTQIGPKEKLAFALSGGFCLVITLGYFIDSGLIRLCWVPPDPEYRSDTAIRDPIIVAVWIVLSTVIYKALSALPGDRIEDAEDENIDEEEK